MPRVRWGIDPSVIDDFDRESQYTPYAGPTPPNAVYWWYIKILKYVAATRDKLPQLRIGLELVAREDREEEKYEGYFIMTFPPISDKTSFRYVPFLDAISVSSTEFTERTICDTDGNIKKIGRWRNDGEQIIAAELKDGIDQNGNPRKEIGWMGPAEGYEEEEADEYEDSEEPF